MEVVSKKIHTSRNVQLQESQVFQMSSGKSKVGAEPVPSRGARCSPRARSELLHLSASKQNETRGFLPTTNCSLPASKCTCVCVCACARHSQGLSVWFCCLSPGSPSLWSWTTCQGLRRGPLEQAGGAAMATSSRPSPHRPLLLASGSLWRLLRPDPGHVSTR